MEIFSFENNNLLLYSTIEMFKGVHAACFNRPWYFSWKDDWLDHARDIGYGSRRRLLQFCNVKIGLVILSFLHEKVLNCLHNGTYLRCCHAAKPDVSDVQLLPQTSAIVYDLRPYSC